MAKSIYVGVGDKARKVKKLYVGVNNVARKVKKVYVGDANGKARLCYINGVSNIPNLQAFTHYNYPIGCGESNSKYMVFARLNSSKTYFDYYNENLTHTSEIYSSSAGDDEGYIISHCNFNDCACFSKYSAIILINSSLTKRTLSPIFRDESGSYGSMMYGGGYNTGISATTSYLIARGCYNYMGVGRYLYSRAGYTYNTSYTESSLAGSDLLPSSITGQANGMAFFYGGEYYGHSLLKESCVYNNSLTKSTLTAFSVNQSNKTDRSSRVGTSVLFSFCSGAPAVIYNSSLSYQQIRNITSGEYLWNTTGDSKYALLAAGTSSTGNGNNMYSINTSYTVTKHSTALKNTYGYATVGASPMAANINGYYIFAGGYNQTGQVDINVAQGYGSDLSYIPSA